MNQSTLDTSTIMPIPFILFIKQEDLENEAHIDPYRSLFEEHGYTCGFLPVFTSKSCNTEELRYILSQLDPSRPNGVIVTSRRAAEIFVTCMMEIERPCSWTTSFVVGERTEKTLRSHGLPCEGSYTGNADGLVRHVCQWIENKERANLLFLSGDKRRDLLPSSLISLRTRIDFDFRELMVYRTDPIETNSLLVTYRESIERLGLPSHIVFFSPSGVEASEVILTHILDRFSPLPKFLAIGGTTQQALMDYFTTRNKIVNILVPHKPNPVELWNCIMKYEDPSWN
jgi:uroporphyrinogen-III synthase